MLRRFSWLTFVLLVGLLMTAHAWAKGYIKVRVAPGCTGEEYVFACWDCYGGDLNWDFGDGGRANGGQVSHVFDRPGTYTVRLSIDWVGFIDADGDGEKEYYTPDGTVDEVLTTTVTVRDCSQPEQDQPTSSSGDATTVTGSAGTGTVGSNFDIDLRCGDYGYGRVGQPVTCVADWDHSRTVTVYWNFSVPVEINGNEVTRIAHVREITFVPQTSGTLYISARAYDMNTGESTSKSAVVRIEGESEEPVALDTANETVVEPQPLPPVPQDDSGEIVASKGEIRVRVNPGCVGREYVFACWDCYGGDLNWDFGDGTRANGGQVEHVFQEPGTYTVKLYIDWLGFIDGDGDGHKEYYRPDGVVEEVKTVTVVVEDCSAGNETEQPLALQTENETTFDVDVICPKEVKAGQAFTCTANWDRTRTVAVYWDFDPGVGRIVEGKEVMVRQINHTRVISGIAPEDAERILVQVRAYDMNSDDHTTETAVIRVVSSANETECSNDLALCQDESACEAAGGVWYEDRCVAPDEATCLMAGGVWDGDNGTCQQCDTAHLNLCTAEEDCLAAGGFWLGDACVPEAEACSPDALWACADREACEEAGGQFDEELGCLEPALAQRVACERLGGQFDNETGECQVEEQARVQANIQHHEEHREKRVELKAEATVPPKRCYYVAAYVPQLDKYFFLGGNNIISEEPVPVICTPGKVMVPLLELQLQEELGVDVQVLHGFYNEETGEFENIETAAEFSL